MEDRFIALDSRIRNKREITCGVIEMFIDVLQEGYEQTPGCDMGYSNNVFRARALSAAREFFYPVDCSLFQVDGQGVDTVASSLPSITCTPEEEVLMPDGCQKGAGMHEIHRSSCNHL